VSRQSATNEVEWSVLSIFGSVVATADGWGRETSPAFFYDPYGERITTPAVDDHVGGLERGVRPTVV